MSILLVCACIIFDILFICYDNKHHDRKSIVLKSLASIMFVLLALSLYKDKALLIVIALVFNMIGDIILIFRNKYSNIKDKLFMAGTVSFFIAHVLMLSYLIKLNITTIKFAFILSVIFYIILFLIFNRVLKVSGIIRVVGIIYTYVIMFTTSMAIINLAGLPTFDNLVLLIGIVLFVISDIILIIFKFNKSDKNIMQIICRSIYYLSQLILALYVGL